jgi:hypothetical protein
VGEREIGVDDAHTWGDRMQDPHQWEIHSLFGDVPRAQGDAVGGEKDALSTTQVGWCLFDEASKCKDLPLSHNRDRL